MPVFKEESVKLATLHSLAMKEANKNYTLPPEYMTGTGPSQCPCPRHSRERGEYNFSPIGRDSTKTNPKNQNSVINH